MRTSSVQIELPRRGIVRCPVHSVNTLIIGAGAAGLKCAQMLASYDSLLAHYGITRDDFERSISWYSKHPEIYERVHDSVLARIDAAMEE